MSFTYRVASHKWKLTLTSLPSMHITQKTVGLLIQYVKSHSSQGSLNGLLMRHNLADADPGPDPKPFSSMSVEKRTGLALNAAFKSGKEDELIDLATTALREHDDVPTAEEWVRDLLASLRKDGFACTPTKTVVNSGSGWSSTSSTEIRWTITALGFTGLPVASLASELADQLSSQGFATAAGHYDQALNAFHAQDWAASNSQLRTTFEAVLIELANRHAGVTAKGGGAAIDALRKSGKLSAGENQYVSGLWTLSHAGGSHPGLSDEEDARHRIYAVSAIVTWLVRTIT